MGTFTFKLKVKTDKKEEIKSSTLLIALSAVFL